MNILQINTVCNFGSTGRIAEQIGIEIARRGWTSHIAYGRKALKSQSNLIPVGAKWHRYPNALWTRIFDSDSCLSKLSTLRFIEKIKEIAPDIIHLHNLHGYYLHAPTLLNFLGEYGKPVVWTLHDCWAITGHCTHFELCGCLKWKSACGDCPQKREYPASWFADRSAENYAEKISLISKMRNLTFVPVSGWLGNLVKSSKIPNPKIKVIRNGIDLSSFCPENACVDVGFIPDRNRKIALFVSNIWNDRKGFYLIPKFSGLLGENFQCVVVGVTKKQANLLEKYGIKSIGKTQNIAELAGLYKLADVFVNVSFEESLPTVNMEAIACGTPVAAFNVGGTPETIPNEKIGIMAEKGNLTDLKKAVIKLASADRSEIRNLCLQEAKNKFDAKKTFKEYISLYEHILE